MKCPKCSYLGFDTGERCRNCGYDFSLMSVEEPAAELSLRLDTGDPVDHDWRAQVDGALAGTNAAAAAASSTVSTTSAAVAAFDLKPAVPPPSFRGEPSLPLFGPSSAAEDEPLIKVPSRPRAPLAVRRTPESPRSRNVARAVERPAPVPELNFTEEPAPVVAPAPPAPNRPQRQPEALQTSAPGRRLLAASIDHAILFTIDTVVLYLTLRIAALTMSELTTLSVVPMATFLALLKLAYFTAFTYVGGQTIGKMAAGIRVVSDDQQPIDVALAVHRALAGAVSLITLGAGFVPALFGDDRRALHDRLAHTRVVTLPTT